MMVLLVTLKQVYGAMKIYPACDKLVKAVERKHGIAGLTDRAGS